MDKIILIGAGGHCKVVLDAIRLAKKYKVIGISDIKAKIGQKILGIPVICTDSQLRNYYKKGNKNCFITVGAINDFKIRMDLFNKIKKIGFAFPNIIHPNSTVSNFTQLGEGNYIACAAIINAGTSIGNNCIINTGSVIEHDCQVGDFVNIAPGTIINGGVKIGRGTQIGSGSVVVQGIKIGKNVIIGCGSVVLDDVPDNILAYGSPCRKIRANK
jgi:UDP-perosamine 4-acetyltransferase